MKYWSAPQVTPPVVTAGPPAFNRVITVGAGGVCVVADTTVDGSDSLPDVSTAVIRYQEVASAGALSSR